MGTSRLGENRPEKRPKRRGSDNITSDVWGGRRMGGAWGGMDKVMRFGNCSHGLTGSKRPLSWLVSK